MFVSGLSAQSADVDSGVLAVQKALNAGDLAAASNLIASQLAAHPTSAALLNLRGVVHAQRNELPDARSDFERAVQLSPALTPGWQNLARACQIQADANESALPCAIAAWQRVLTQKQGDAEALLSLATLFHKEDRYSESLAQVERLPASERTNINARLLRCADLAALGKMPEANKIASDLAAEPKLSEEDFLGFRTSWEKPAAAPVVITLVKALDARNAATINSLRLLGVAYERQQQIAEARSTLERVAILDPSNPAHLIELARLAELTNDHEGALGYLGHAREVSPGEAQIHFLFAMVSMKLNLPVEARSSLEKALAIDPRNPAYNYAMGFVILSTREAATAAEYFKHFVEARPAEPKGHYALGIADFASGDWEHAKAEMELVEHNPSTSGGAEYFLGRIARLQDQLDASEQHLKSSIQLLPGFAESHTELARVYLRQNNLDAANAELKKALALDPQSFPANEQLLVIYRRTHDARSEAQAELLKKLDEDRSKRAELMLRTIEVRP
ncbi:MAG TPA: tetratricopeptide repeat protein [Bryobacteraceae bacterium]|jgi:tetratricopeptide (TPR) repeat protein|nr:tetratricopeptide repeat protein [Bryobacteraceae bacterium]